MNDVYVFLGPTLSREIAKEHLDAVYLPPAEQGDVLHLLRTKPRAIVIIDGYFDRVPAVWHKEVLAAMSQGVTVVGASSMGALRAAELHAFGMHGVGEIFEWYRTGLIDADDEVAVAHAPIELGYLAQSDALVNMRKTLGNASRDGVLSRESLASLLARAKRTFFGDRSYGRLLHEGAVDFASEAERAGLREYLRTGRVDLKKEDAILALELTRTFDFEAAAKRPARFELMKTDFFSDFAREDRFIAERRGVRVAAFEVVDHARVAMPDFAEVYARARTRRIHTAFARRLGVTVAAEHLQAKADAFRRERGLTTAEGTRAWLRENQMSAEELDALMEDLVLADRAVELHGCLRTDEIVRQLQIEGRWKDCVDLALERGAALASVSDPAARLPDDETLYAAHLAARGLPDTTDADTYAASLGYDDQALLLLDIAKEHLCQARDAGEVEHSVQPRSAPTALPSCTACTPPA